MSLVVLLRLDNETHISEEWYSDNLNHLLDNVDVIMLSDYDKGSIQDSLITKIRASKKPFIVDTKKSDISTFSNAKVIKPNLKVLVRLYRTILILPIPEH